MQLGCLDFKKTIGFLASRPDVLINLPVTTRPSTSSCAEPVPGKFFPCGWVGQFRMMGPQIKTTKNLSQIWNMCFFVYVVCLYLWIYVFLHWFMFNWFARFFLLLRLSAHALLVSIALFAVCSCFVHIFELHLKQVHLFQVCSYANSFFLGITNFWTAAAGYSSMTFWLWECVCVCALKIPEQ